MGTRRRVRGLVHLHQADNTGMTRLPTESSDVRWRKRAKYVVQPVFGPLWHVLLLVCLPATEKSEVITYKQLK